MDIPTKKPPVKKKRLNLPGKLIETYPAFTPKNPCELKDLLTNISNYLISKGWCIHYHPNYIGLTGYTTETMPRVPAEKKKTDTHYHDYANKNNEPKTRIYVSREDRILLIYKVGCVDKHGKCIGQHWEVQTKWTSKRNIFDNLSDAWDLFRDIEQRYDPGTIVWSKLKEYDEFEPY